MQLAYRRVQVVSPPGCKSVLANRFYKEKFLNLIIAGGGGRNQRVAPDLKN